VNLLCLVPTYGRPQLVANAIALFDRQTYPADKRRMMVFDDGGQIESIADAKDRGVMLMTTATRAPHLAAKYNQMLAAWRRPNLAWPCDAVIVWDDDDVYLPWHLDAYASALRKKPWAHPRWVWSTYTGSPSQERADGRFHGSLGIRRDLLAQLGGWIDTPRADFDQQMIAACAAHGPPGRPDDVRRPSYVFRWGDTQATHCQGLMRSPDDVTWYARCAVPTLPRVEVLEPRLDYSAAMLLELITE